MPPIQLFGISLAFARVSQTVRQVTYVLLTRSPLGINTSFDLHVLGTPPAFILSQDQTLKKFILVQNYNLVYCLKIDVNVSCTSVQFSKINLRYIHSIFIRPRRTCAFISYYYEIMVSTNFLLKIANSNFSFLQNIFFTTY